MNSIGGRSVSSRNYNLPFGFVQVNGLNFARSVTNPNSRLSRMVKFIRWCGPNYPTKYEILEFVFGVKVVRTRKVPVEYQKKNPNYTWNSNTPYYLPNSTTFGHRVSLTLKNTQNGRKVTRGWGSYLFGLARATGFIQSTRIGNKVVYSLGPRAKLIK